MPEMTSKERFTRMFNHQEADRVPVIDGPWGATIERWQREGMPEGVDITEYFGMDRIAGIGVDTSPHYPEEIVEETDEYRIHTTNWGVTMRNWKHAASTPEYLDFTVVDRDSWEKAKEHLKPDRSRLPLENLRKNYRTWREKGYFITGNFWFGFDVTHARICGTERCLMAMLEDPEWVNDMFSTELELCIQLMDTVWDEGYEFDAVFWCDDMGYKNNLFFSRDLYRELLKPYQKKAIEWAHAKGIKARLHSCGNVMPLVPEFLEIGLDGLNPLEVKAGMDPIKLKREHGDILLLHGGINALHYGEMDILREEMTRVIPIMKEHGGYIFSSDHSVPSSISLNDFKEVIRLGKELGKY